MATPASREGFKHRAFRDPYDFMTDADKEFISEEFDVLPIDATKQESLDSEMSWAEKHLGGGGIMSVTDYGRHRNNYDTLSEFEEMIREEIETGFPSQYTKIMDEEKERIADKLLAISRESGYVVVPYFED